MCRLEQVSPQFHQYQHCALYPQAFLYSVTVTSMSSKVASVFSTLADRFGVRACDLLGLEANNIVTCDEFYYNLSSEQACSLSNTCKLSNSDCSANLPTVLDQELRCKLLPTMDAFLACTMDSRTSMVITSLPWSACFLNVDSCTPMVALACLALLCLSGLGILSQGRLEPV